MLSDDGGYGGVEEGESVGQDDDEGSVAGDDYLAFGLFELWGEVLVFEDHDL
jgi:hypothetical protein